jgi:hypothetical protein
MKRCHKCVLPECTPNIVFDKNGICDYCHSHQSFTYRGESELLRILYSQQRTDSKYDIIVPVSGGRDSSYTLLKLVKDYHMKVLAVNHENPFTHPQAKTNIDNAITALNVDIIRFRLKNRIFERTFRNNATAWFRRPTASMINMLCIACRTVSWEIARIAKKHKIHCVVYGANPFEDTSFKKELVHASRNDSVPMAITKALYAFLKETSKNPAYLNPICIPTMLRGYLFSVMNAFGINLVAHNLTRIGLFYFLEWNEKEVLSRIKSELNWDYPHELGSTWRFDCRIGHVKDYMYMKMIGMTEKDDYYAKMVREGLMTREDALLRLQKENIIHLDEMNLVLNKVGIQQIDFPDKVNDTSA